VKLASLKSRRDGALILVSRDLTRAVAAGFVAPTLQSAIEDWDAVAPELQALAARLECGLRESFPFREQDCASPLPRAYQWGDGSAYVNHVALVRKSRGAEMPESFWSDPLMYQGGSDAFLGPRDDIPLIDEKHDLDLEAEIAVVTDDVPMGVTPQDAREHIKLVMLVNDVTLRGLVAPELAKGFGFFQSKPSSAFSPVAVTPDELGDAWDGGRSHTPRARARLGLARSSAQARSPTVTPTAGPAGRSRRAATVTPASPSNAWSKNSSMARRERRS